MAIQLCVGTLVFFLLFEISIVWVLFLLALPSRFTWQMPRKQKHIGYLAQKGKKGREWFERIEDASLVKEECNICLEAKYPSIFSMAWFVHTCFVLLA